MNDEVTQSIITAIVSLAAIGTAIGVKLAWEWIWKKIFGGDGTKHISPTVKAVMEVVRLSGIAVETQLEFMDKKQEYKETCRGFVRRAVGIMVSHHKAMAREAASCVSEECGDTESSIHIFSTASESLKHNLVEVYMNSVDINGFASKTPAAWKQLLQDLYENMMQETRDHYSNWYKHGVVSYDDIIKRIEEDRDWYENVSEALMDSLKEQAIILHNIEDQLAQRRKEADAEILKWVEAIDNPKKK